MRLRAPTYAVFVCLTLCVSCGDEPSDSSPTAPEALPFAALDLTGRILGSAANDDDADIEITLKETNGIAFDINFFRLTCNNRSTQEWGAESFVEELGSNRIPGGTTLVFQRHYTCRVSGRPQEIIVDITDQNGHHLQVNAAPYHPDWPGA